MCLGFIGLRVFTGSIYKVYLGSPEQAAGVTCGIVQPGFQV